RGDGPVPDGAPPGELGGDVPGEQRERRQASERQDDQGEPVAAGGAGAGGARGRPEQGDVSGVAVPAAGGAAGGPGGGGGRGGGGEPSGRRWRWATRCWASSTRSSNAGRPIRTWGRSIWTGWSPNG